MYSRINKNIQPSNLQPDFSQLSSTPNLLPTSPNIIPSDPSNINSFFETIDSPNIPSLDQIQKSSDVMKALEYIPDVPFALNYQTNQHMNLDGFPKIPYFKLMVPEFFQNYDVHTLLYIFFYFPSTPQQFFAAEQLKKLGWHYYSSHKTWYHRIGEPESTNQRFETGRYEYLDHSENHWQIKQKGPIELDLNYLDKD